MVSPGDVEYTERLTAFIPYDKRIKSGCLVRLEDPHDQEMEWTWRVDRVYPTPIPRMNLGRSWNNNI
jgi:hypothetical protein